MNYSAPGAAAALTSSDKRLTRGKVIKAGITSAGPPPLRFNQEIPSVFLRADTCFYEPPPSPPPPRCCRLILKVNSAVSDPFQGPLDAPVHRKRKRREPLTSDQLRDGRRSRKPRILPTNENLGSGRSPVLTESLLSDDRLLMRVKARPGWAELRGSSLSPPQ